MNPVPAAVGALVGVGALGTTALTGFVWEAAATAVGTTGSAVVTAGLTAVTALCGLSVTGIRFPAEVRERPSPRPASRGPARPGLPLAPGPGHH